VKLIISDLGALRGFVSREFAWTIGDLVTTFGWKHVEPRELCPGELKRSVIDRLGGMPEVILFWECYWFINDNAEEVDRLDCRKAVFADDIHIRRDDQTFLRWPAFIIADAILCTYENAFVRLFPSFAARKPVVWVPHAASPEFMLPFNEHSRNSVLLSGALGPAYPLRQQMKSLCDLGTLPIVHVPHPGYHEYYNHATDPRVGCGYAGLIHRFRSVFTDSSIHRYIVAKHFEIPATGALLIAERAAADLLGQLGMVEGEHYIATSSTELEATIRFVVDECHHPELDQVRQRGQRLIWEKHTTSERARLINATLNEG
jgi:hypothetical protein